MKNGKQASVAILWLLGLASAGCTSVYPPPLSPEEAERASSILVVLHKSQKGMGVSSYVRGVNPATVNELDVRGTGTLDPITPLVALYNIAQLFTLEAKRQEEQRVQSESAATARQLTETTSLISFNDELARQLELHMADAIDWIEQVVVKSPPPYTGRANSSHPLAWGIALVPDDMKQYFLKSSSDVLLDIAVKHGVTFELNKYLMAVSVDVFVKPLNDPKATMRKVNDISFTFVSPPLCESPCETTDSWVAGLNRQIERSINHAGHILAGELNRVNKGSQDHGTSWVYDGNQIEVDRSLPFQIRFTNVSSVPLGEKLEDADRLGLWRMEEG